MYGGQHRVGEGKGPIEWSNGNRGGGKRSCTDTGVCREETKTNEKLT